MKLKIEIPGLIEAINRLTNKLVYVLAEEPDGSIAELPLPFIPKKEIQRKSTRKTKDGLYGSVYINSHYGLTQYQTSIARKALGINNHGTINNPRYTPSEVARMVEFYNRKTK